MLEKYMFQQEFVYIIDDKTDKKREDGSCICYRDKEKFNRFIFEWPPEWRTSSVKERVIGFRSLWISKEYRHLKFNINIDDSQGGEYTIEIDSWLSDEHDLRKLQSDIRRGIQKYIDKQTEEGYVIPFHTDDFTMEFDYDNGTFNNFLITFSFIFFVCGLTCCCLGKVVRVILGKVFECLVLVVGC